MAYRPATIVLQYLAHAGQAGLKAVDGAIIDQAIHARINRPQWLKSFFIVLKGCYQPNSFIRLCLDLRQPILMLIPAASSKPGASMGFLGKDF